MHDFQSSFCQDKTQKNSPFFQFVPLICSKKKKNLVLSSFDRTNLLIANSRHGRSRTILRYGTSWTRARHHSNTRRKIELQVSRLHRNTRVIFMDSCHVSLASGSERKDAIFSRNSRLHSRIHATPRGDTRIMARGPRHIDISRVVAQFPLARRRPSERESSVFLFFSFLFSLPSLSTRLEQRVPNTAEYKVFHLRSKLFTANRDEFRLGNRFQNRFLSRFDSNSIRF